MNITGLNDCSNEQEHIATHGILIMYLIETKADLFSAFRSVFPLNVHHFVIVNNQQPSIQVYTDSGDVGWVCA